jgi:hypothetical protein
LQIHYPKSNIYNAAEPTLQFSLLLRAWGIQQD